MWLQRCEKQKSYKILMITSLECEELHHAKIKHLISFAYAELHVSTIYNAYRTAPPTYTYKKNNSIWLTPTKKLQFLLLDFLMPVKYNIEK